MIIVICFISKERSQSFFRVLACDMIDSREYEFWIKAYRESYCVCYLRILTVLTPIMSWISELLEDFNLILRFFGQSSVNPFVEQLVIEA